MKSLIELLSLVSMIVGVGALAFAGAQAMRVTPTSSIDSFSQTSGPQALTVAGAMIVAFVVLGRLKKRYG